MPRIYSVCNDPIDFCQSCFPSEDDYLTNMESGCPSSDSTCEICPLQTKGNYDEGGCSFGYECPHPDYEDTDYVCHECGEKLTEEDN